jgi:hypothetical protein
MSCPINGLSLVPIVPWGRPLVTLLAQRLRCSVWVLYGRLRVVTGGPSARVFIAIGGGLRKSKLLPCKPSRWLTAPALGDRGEPHAEEATSLKMSRGRQSTRQSVQVYEFIKVRYGVIHNRQRT